MSMGILQKLSSYHHQISANTNSVIDHQQQKNCEHRVMTSKLFDDIFIRFIQDYEYLIENNKDIITVQTKCFKCYKDIVFRYNVVTGKLVPSKDKYSEDDKGLNMLEMQKDFKLRLYFSITFPIQTNTADLHKREMLIHTSSVLNKALDKDNKDIQQPTYYDIKRTFNVLPCQDIVTMVEGVLTNTLEMEVDYPAFKKIYKTLIQEFKKENVSFSLLKK